MDEREVVPRREAVVGLSLLGVFSLALVGTLAYRIVSPTKHVPPKVDLTEWASQPPLPVDPSELFDPAISEREFAADEPSLVEPIPTTAEESASVPAAATTDSPTPPLVDAPVSGQHLMQPAPPTFVSPAGR